MAQPWNDIRSWKCESCMNQLGMGVSQFCSGCGVDRPSHSQEEYEELQKRLAFLQMVAVDDKQGNSIVPTDVLRRV